MWKKLSEILAAVGGAIISFFTTMPPLVYILVAVMTMDFITGLICAAMGKSKKTANGYIASHAAFEGLMKKVLIIFVVLLAAEAQTALTGQFTVGQETQLTVFELQHPAFGLITVDNPDLSVLKGML